MKAKEIFDPPSIEVGDNLLIGKFKNKKAVVKGFSKDDHNQPVLKTDKGDVKLFKPRLPKLEEALSWTRQWRPKIILKKGTILYHGTAQDFEDNDISGPAWFSTNRDVALKFAQRHGGNIVKTYKLNKNITLPLIENSKQFNNFCEMFYIQPYSAEDMSDGVQNADLPGWYIPDNYKPGDDILICDVSVVSPMDIIQEEKVIKYKSIGNYSLQHVEIEVGPFTRTKYFIKKGNKTITTTDNPFYAEFVFRELASGKKLKDIAQQIPNKNRPDWEKDIPWKIEENWLINHKNIKESITPKFILDPALDPSKYIMTNSLRDVHKWRAYTYVGQEMRDGSGKQGSMGKVGYVMISLSSNKIIPIAIGDEHHRGYNLLWDLTKTKKKRKGLEINPNEYFPIYAIGNNYIYSKKEIPKYLIAIRKYFSYGGSNTILYGSSDYRGLSLTLKQFLDLNGDIDIKPGQIGHIGQLLLEKFSILANALARARQNLNLINIAGKAALEVVKFIENITSLSNLFSDKEIEDWTKMIQHYVDNEDENGLSQMFFSFTGIKTRIHHNLKEIQKSLLANPDDYNFEADNAKRIWGNDLNLAIDMLTDQF